MGRQRGVLLDAHCGCLLSLLLENDCRAATTLAGASVPCELLSMSDLICCCLEGEGACLSFVSGRVCLLV